MRFPASLSHHHLGIGGLYEHTAQVISIAETMCSSSFVGADNLIVRQAAMWHDLGKTEEYEEVEDGKWERVLDRAAHIQISADKFKQAAEDELEFDGKKEFIDAVVHCIYAHHGRLEWNTIEEPKTVEAHILHFADQLSVQYDKGLCAGEK